MKRIPGKYVKACMNLIFAVVVLLGCIYVLPKLIWLFMPFIVGWIISLMANPLVRFFEEKLKIKRRTGSALVIISVLSAICLGIYGIGLKLVREMLGLLDSLPAIWQSIQLELEGIGQKWFVVISHFPEDMIEKVEYIGGIVGEKLSLLVKELGLPSVDAVGNIATNIPAILIAVIMSLLSAYFFVADKDSINEVLKKRLPLSWQEKWNLMGETLRKAIGGYVKAQFKIEVWVYLILVVGLALLRVKYGYLIALGIALLDIFPVFGTGAVLIPWAVIKLLSGQYLYCLGLLIIWGVGQLTRQIVQPKIVGDSMGLPPLPTLILLYVGYRFGGVVGMILAVPLGILILTMNEAGFFEDSKNSIRIIVNGINQFRKLTKEDMEGMEPSNENGSEKDIKGIESSDANLSEKDMEGIKPSEVNRSQKEKEKK